MVVERFQPGDLTQVFDTVRMRGRLLPEGLIYIDSWISASLDVCFQLMECDDPLLFQEWAAGWSHLADFEIIPVVQSRATAALFSRLADQIPPAT